MHNNACYLARRYCTGYAPRPAFPPCAACHRPGRAVLRPPRNPGRRQYRAARRRGGARGLSPPRPGEIPRRPGKGPRGAGTRLPRRGLPDGGGGYPRTEGCRRHGQPARHRGPRRAPQGRRQPLHLARCDPRRHAIAGARRGAQLHRRAAGTGAGAAYRPQADAVAAPRQGAGHGGSRTDGRRRAAAARQRRTQRQAEPRYHRPPPRSLAALRQPLAEGPQHRPVVPEFAARYRPGGGLYRHLFAAAGQRHAGRLYGALQQFRPHPRPDQPRRGYHLRLALHPPPAGAGTLLPQPDGGRRPQGFRRHRHQWRQEADPLRALRRAIQRRPGGRKRASSPTFPSNGARASA